MPTHEDGMRSKAGRAKRVGMAEISFGGAVSVRGGMRRFGSRTDSTGSRMCSVTRLSSVLYSPQPTGLLTEIFAQLRWSERSGR